MKDIQWKVIVRCMTYNQSKYITDTLNGFCIQETSFPFVCCIVDDASTDGEQDVINEYLSSNFNLTDSNIFFQKETDYAHITFAQHNKNKNCYFAVLLLKENHYSKGKSYLKNHYISEWSNNVDYVAYCEGDDYWIESKKLQWQVDYLDLHPDITYSCCRFKILIQKTGEMQDDWNVYFKNPANQSVSEFVFDTEYAFSKTWITLTLTQIVRSSALDMEFIRQFKYGRDVHQIYSILKKGKGVCHSFYGGVYRINSLGIHGGISYIKQHYNNYLVYKELYDKTKEPWACKIMKKEYKQLIRMRKFLFPKSYLELNCWVNVLIDKTKEIYMKILGK